MKYLRFNQTELEASVLCLGTVSFGTDLPKEQAFAQLDTFAGLGGNIIDTAHVYGDWEPGERARSEKVIGEWMEQRGCRAEMVISTKGGHPLLETMDVSRLSLADLEVDLQGSLDALRTGSIDLYFLHRDDPDLPVEEVIEWLEAQKSVGRIRYYGCSNWSLPRIQEAQKYAHSRGYSGFVCNQIQDSLADINRADLEKSQMVAADPSFIEYHVRTGMNLMAYMAAAHGYFPKKSANLPMDDDDISRFDLPQNRKMLEGMKNIQPYSVNDLAFQYVIQKPYPSIPIASFENTVQMVEIADSCCKDVPFELVERIAAFKLR
jgi:aryl-alcohol dehydrogenase-like predicted oxidoreductase